jgi:hypothetical protein
MALPRPEHAHTTDHPSTETFTPRPAHTTIGWLQDRRPVVSKLPLHSLAAAKTSPHIRIGPEPVLAAHARSPPASGSHHLAGADIAPHSEPIFFKICTMVQIISLWYKSCTSYSFYHYTIVFPTMSVRGNYFKYTTLVQLSVQCISAYVYSYQCMCLPTNEF